MPKSANTQIAVIGIDIGKNSFHVVGHDKRGSIVLRQKWSRGQIEARLANLPPCLIDGCRSEVVRYVEVMDGKFGRKKGDILSCMFPVVETDEMTWSRCHACACASSRGATHPPVDTNARARCSDRAAATQSWCATMLPDRPCASKGTWRQLCPRDAQQRAMS